MGRPLYPMIYDDDEPIHASPSSEPPTPTADAAQPILCWAVKKDFDPDSEEFFTSAVEEFGVPSLPKGDAQTSPDSSSDSEPSTPSSLWAGHAEHLRRWQRVAMRLTGEAGDCDHDHDSPHVSPSETESIFTSSELPSRLRALLQHIPPLPTSQSLRTPEAPSRVLSASPDPEQALGARADVAASPSD